MANVKPSRADSWLADWELVSRVEWDAVEPWQEPLVLAPPVPLIVFTQTNTRTCTSNEICVKVLKKLQNRHLKTRPDIGYNFLIGGDGRVYEGTGYYNNGLLAAPKGGEPKGTAGAVITAEETDKPLPWDQAHGNFISIAFIGDHSDIFPRLKKAKYRSHELPTDHPLQLYTPKDKRITKQFKRSQEVLKWLREYKQVRLDATVRWLKASKWRQFLQKVRQNCGQEDLNKPEEE